MASVALPGVAAAGTPEVIDEIAGLPQPALRGLLSEAELSALAEAPLMPFDVTSRFEQAVPFVLEEYLELVDTMGRALHPAKRGVIPATTPPLLTRLGMDAEAFLAAPTISSGTLQVL